MFEKILSHGGLLVVLISLLAISLMGAITRILKSLQPQDIAFEDIDTFKSNKSKSQPLSFSAIPHDELKKLKRLLDREDTLQIAIFCASYHCSMDDISKINESLKTPLNPFINYVDLIPDNIDSLYLSEEFRVLSDSQKSAIEKLQTATSREIDKDFIQQFGGIVFMENFIMYQHLCHADSAYFHIPEGSELRRLFDTFTQHGLARTGKEIPVSDRIRGIDWSRLQMLAGKLGMNRFLHDREDAISQLSQKPLIEEILDRDFPANDDFLLLKKDWDSEKIEVEWQAYNAFAEILLKSQRNARNEGQDQPVEAIKGKEVAV